MKKKNIILIAVFLLAIQSSLIAQNSNTELKNNGANDKFGTIGEVRTVFKFSHSNCHSKLNYFIDYKKDTLYILDIRDLAIQSHDIAIAITNSQLGLVAFNSDTLSLGRIKNYIKQVANGEHSPPISINNTFFFVSKSKKNLTIAMFNNNGLLRTSVTLSKNEINKLFDDKFLQ